MPTSNLKPGDFILALRSTDQGQVIEADWRLVRFEPSSGNAVIEKGSAHAILPKELLERFNFPESPEVLAAINALPEAKQATAMAAFVRGDFLTVKNTLFNEFIELDPAFAGVVTINDLRDKFLLRQEELNQRVAIMEKKFEDVKMAYDNAVRSGHQLDEMDNRLMMMENIQNQLETEQFRAAKIPEWITLLKSIEALDAQTTDH